jgi:hypothetical protein
MYKFAIMYMRETNTQVLKIMEVIDMKNMLKVVIRFITKDVIAPDFNPWLVQREVDVPKRFV